MLQGLVGWRVGLDASGGDVLSSGYYARCCAAPAAAATSAACTTRRHHPERKPRAALALTLKAFGGSSPACAARSESAALTKWTKRSRLGVPLSTVSSAEAASGSISAQVSCTQLHSRRGAKREVGERAR